jgi:hypothetical protein
MAKIDGYTITVETETPGYEVAITSQPIEKGEDVTDHVQPKASSLNLSGRVAGPDAAKIHSYLVSAMKTGKIVSFSGRTAFKGLIESFTPPRDYKIANGFTFSMTLVEVPIATSSFVSKLPAPIKVQAAKVVSAGVKQTKSKTSKNKTSKSKTSKGKNATAKGKNQAAKVSVVKFKEGSKWAK